MANECACGCAGAGACNATLGAVVTDADTLALKQHLHPQFEATRRLVETCRSLPPDRLIAFRTFYDSWRVYYEKPESFWRALAEYEEGLRFQNELRDWQEFLIQACGSNAPLIERPDEHKNSDLASAVKWGAIAVVSVAAVYGIATVLSVVPRRKSP